MFWIKSSKPKVINHRSLKQLNFARKYRLRTPIFEGPVEPQKWPVERFLFRLVQG